MARVFITGSSDGLGRMAAQFLVEHGQIAHNYRFRLRNRGVRVPRPFVGCERATPPDDPLSSKPAESPIRSMHWELSLR